MAASQVACEETEEDMSEFFRFPSTPHLFAAKGAELPRDDKLLSASALRELLAGEVTVEEKLDGANVGISIDSHGNVQMQNRGTYLIPPFSGQFARLEQWLRQHEDHLFDVLSGNPELILFGEWCAARHSLGYASLPDWWLMFDVYDRRAGRFWSVAERNRLARQLGVAVVPCLFRGAVTPSKLEEFLEAWQSHYREGPMEGLVVRRDDGAWLHSRGKLVRADFSQTIEEHWRSRPIEWNRIKF